MKIVITSDTHMRHKELEPMKGDVLIHCGDFYDGFKSRDRDLLEIKKWFAEQDFRLKLFIGGNHDFPVFKKRKNIQEHLGDIVYLEDSKYTFEGITFYGSPWVPELSSWAFYGNDEHREKTAKLIPVGVDVLITHVPPHGILDSSRILSGLGCKYLSKRVEEIKPRIHCFGHVHASYGNYRKSGTHFYNASAITHSQDLNPPYIIDLEAEPVGI